MKKLTMAALLLALMSSVQAQAPADWRGQVERLVRDKFLHPAWGAAHAQRDYKLARELAQAEGWSIDDDVLYAAAYLHDMGAIPAYRQQGVDHAQRSVALAEGVLRDAGFPMAKFPAVADAILSHMYNAPVAASREAQLLHDADTLDFLGAMGVARLLAANGTASTMGDAVAGIAQFSTALPSTLKTPAARAWAVPRVQEMQQFLQALDRQSYGKSLL
ncbi:MAG TPA: HD domain-containing protein [Burkholderiaceae bacterium]